MVLAAFVWCIAALIFLLFELGHPNLFFFLSFCLASLASALVSVFDYSLLVQYLSFMGSFLGAFLMLNFFVKHMQRPIVRTNIYALEGQKALVTMTIESPASGQVKIHGQIWTAYSLHDEPLSMGDQVIIVQVRGAHLVVRGIN